MVAGRHDSGAVAETLHPDLQAGGREVTPGLVWIFETSKLIPRDTPPTKNATSPNPS